MYSASYLVTSSLNVKKIPILNIEREYEFTDVAQEKINWQEDIKYGWILKNNSKLEIKINLPTLNMSRKFTYSTDDAGRRWTSIPSSKCDRGSLDSISIYGCSITYGHSLSDNQTYPWLLQQRFKDYKVHNYGVAGYSLYQSMLKLQSTISCDKPRIVVVGFHEDLGWRNTCSFEWAERLENTWKIPSAVSIRKVLRTYKPMAYFNFGVGKKIRILKLLERVINKIKFMGRGKDLVIRHTMEHILLKMRHICEKNGSKMLVACLDDCGTYYQFLNENKFDWCISEVNTKELTESGMFKWILYPYDNHPNEDANLAYCNSIEIAIKEIIRGKNIRPSNVEYKLKTKIGDPGKFVYPHS
jgi:hypothetical protein